MTKIFDHLLEKARKTIQAELKQMEGEEWDPSSVDSVILGSQDDLLPETVDAEWCRAVLAERPALLDGDIAGGSLREVILEAVEDLVLEELEDEMLEYARELGLLPRVAPTM